MGEPHGVKDVWPTFVSFRSAGTAAHTPSRVAMPPDRLQIVFHHSRTGKQNEGKKRQERFL
jgi:hypothetical protein